jgi:hypothetical protein
MFTNTIAQRITVGFGAVIAGLAVSTTIFAATASAQPIGPDGPEHRDGQCAIVHTDDNGNETVEYVPKGTRDGYLGYCGADGEWHAGILIDERATVVSPDNGGPKKPPVVVRSAPVVSARQ